MTENKNQQEITSEYVDETLEMSEKEENNNLESLEAVVEKEQTQENPELIVEEAVSNSATEETETQPGETKEFSEIEAFQKEIANLKEKLEQQTKITEAIQVQYARMAADFDNFRKRSIKEREILEQQVKRNTISELLQVVDNFERARTQIKPVTEGEMGIHKSYQGVYKNLVDSLKRIGVSAMRPEGEPFDPNYHEAMMREPTNEYPEGIVMEQLVRGYLLGDQVLRHAMVKVAAPLESMVSSEEENTQTTQEQDPPSS